MSPCSLFFFDPPEYYCIASLAGSVPLLGPWKQRLSQISSCPSPLFQTLFILFSKLYLDSGFHGLSDNFYENVFHEVVFCEDVFHEDVFYEDVFSESKIQTLMCFLITLDLVLWTWGNEQSAGSLPQSDQQARVNAESLHSSGGIDKDRGWAEVAVGELTLEGSVNQETHSKDWKKDGKKKRWKLQVEVVTPQKLFSWTWSSDHGTTLKWVRAPLTGSGATLRHWIPDDVSMELCRTTALELGLHIATSLHWDLLPPSGSFGICSPGFCTWLTSFSFPILLCWVISFTPTASDAIFRLKTSKYISPA